MAPQPSVPPAIRSTSPLALAVIAAIGGQLVLVPLLMIPVVVLTSLAVQPALDRLARENLGQGFSKQGVVVETVAGLETVKAGRAGPMLEARGNRAMTDTTTITVRVSKELRDRLDVIAKETRRSKSFLSSEAIEEFVDDRTIGAAGVAVGPEKLEDVHAHEVVVVVNDAVAAGGAEPAGDLVARVSAPRIDADGCPGPRGRPRARRWWRRCASCLRRRRWP